MYFRYFVINSLGKGRDPQFEQTLIPITQGCFEPGLAEIGPVVLEKKFFNFVYIFSQIRYG